MEAPRREMFLKYLQVDVACPWCTSDKIVAVTNLEGDTNIAWRTIVCETCRAEWQDEYRLDDISWLVDDERVYASEDLGVRSAVDTIDEVNGLLKDILKEFGKLDQAQLSMSRIQEMHDILERRT